MDADAQNAPPESVRLYRGDGKPRDTKLPEAPPWRRFHGHVMTRRTIEDPTSQHTFVATEEVRRAVDAALVLRRPLLLTGRPGSGKSSLIDSVARELRLGRVMRWHVTSRSTLGDALYRYDAIGRLHAEQVEEGAGSDIAQFLTLGPLGTALLPTDRPRALLIDEIDKSDVDLPNDLLNIFERGEYEIPELARLNQDRVNIREHAGDQHFPITQGHVVCREFPFVVLTSNGERDFPAPFLRRCIRLRMPDPDVELLTAIVARHLGEPAATRAGALIEDFARRAEETRAHATDQLMNAVFMVTAAPELDADERDRLVKLLTKALTSDVP